MSTGVKRALPKQGYSPDLNKYVTKNLRIKLNGGRQVEGVVVGVDVFMNVALERAFEIVGNQRKNCIKLLLEEIVYLCGNYQKKLWDEWGKQCLYDIRI